MFALDTPRSSRISIIRVNATATVCEYIVFFQVSVILANKIAYEHTSPSIYLTSFSYYALK